MIDSINPSAWQRYWSMGVWWFKTLYIIILACENGHSALRKGPFCPQHSKLAFSFWIEYIIFNYSFSIISFKKYCFFLLFFHSGTFYLLDLDLVTGLPRRCGCKWSERSVPWPVEERGSIPTFGCRGWDKAGGRRPFFDACRVIHVAWVFSYWKG